MLFFPSSFFECLRARQGFLKKIYHNIFFLWMAPPVFFFKLSNPRNRFKFSWFDRTVDLSTVFDMVTEAPPRFISQDVFGIHTIQALALENADDVIVKSMDNFKSGHLSLIPKLSGIASRRLYSTAKADKRLNSKTTKMASFIRDCLSVIANEHKDVSVPSLLPDSSTIKKIARSVCLSLSHATEYASCPPLKASDYPHIAESFIPLFSSDKIKRRIIAECLIRSSKVDCVNEQLIYNQIYFLFYYAVGLVSKYIRISEDGRSNVLLLRDETEVPSISRDEGPDSIDLGNSTDSSKYLSEWVVGPSKKEFDYAGRDAQFKRCLVHECATLPTDQLAALIVGQRILNLLNSQRRNELFKKVSILQEAHREFLYGFTGRALPWVARKGGLVGSRKCSAFISFPLMAKFAEDVSSILMQCNGRLFQKINRSQIVHTLIHSMRNWAPGKPFLSEMELCWSPVGIPFIANMHRELVHDSPDPSFISSLQSAFFQNTTFFMLHYILHWIRIVSIMHPSKKVPYCRPHTRLTSEVKQKIAVISVASKDAQLRKLLTVRSQGSSETKLGVIKHLLEGNYVDGTRGRRRPVKEEAAVDGLNSMEEGAESADSGQGEGQPRRKRKRIKVEKHELDEEEETVKCSKKKSRRKKNKDHRDEVEVKPEPLPVCETVDVSSDDDDVIISSVVSPPSIPSYLQKAYDALSKANSTPVKVEPSVSPDRWTSPERAASSTPAYLRKALDRIKKVVEEEEDE